MEALSRQRMGLLVYRLIQRQVRLYLRMHAQPLPGNQGMTATPGGHSVRHWGPTTLDIKGLTVRKNIECTHTPFGRLRGGAAQCPHLRLEGVHKFLKCIIRNRFSNTHGVTLSAVFDRESIRAHVSCPTGRCANVRWQVKEIRSPDELS
jgi:hypothetical protein